MPNLLDGLDDFFKWGPQLFMQEKSFVGYIKSDKILFLKQLNNEFCFGTIYVNLFMKKQN